MRAGNRVGDKTEGRKRAERKKERVKGGGRRGLAVGLQGSPTRFVDLSTDRPSMKEIS